MGPNCPVSRSDVVLLPACFECSGKQSWHGPNSYRCYDSLMESEKHTVMAFDCRLCANADMKYGELIWIISRRQWPNLPSPTEGVVSSIHSQSSYGFPHNQAAEQTSSFDCSKIKYLTAVPDRIWTVVCGTFHQNTEQLGLPHHFALPLNTNYCIKMYGSVLTTYK